MKVEVFDGGDGFMRKDDRRIRHAGLDHGAGRLDRRAVVHRQPGGDVKPEAVAELVEVCSPRDRDGDVPHGIFDDEVPADHPCHEFPERRVRIRVRAPGDRDERGEFAVT